MSYKGVDLSQHNGSVDFNKLKNDADFAILRIGWVGNTDNKMDTKFNEFYAAAKKAGVKIGAYVYTYSKSEDAATKGAEWIVKQIKGKTFDLPIYCDMEDASIKGLGKSKLTAITKSFNTVIEHAGYWAGVYANLDWFKNYLDESLRTKYTTWIAHYTSGTDKYKGTYDMWQNSSKGKVAGVSGNVDTNYLYRELFSQIAGKKVEAKASAKKTTTTKKTTTIKKTTTKKSSNGAEKFDSAYKNGKTYKVKASALNMRSGAGTGHLVVKILKHGSSVTWYGYYTVVKGVTWKYVQDGSGKCGYVSSEWLK